MMFDIAMPLTLFAVTMVSLFLNKKTEGKLKSTLEEREFRIRDAVLLVTVMVTTISLIVLFREMVTPLMILFMLSYSSLLFVFTYIFSNSRWYVAIVSPAIFILLYVLFRGTAIWSNYLVNMYGVVFAILITLYIGSLFTWKTTLVFTVLLTIVDIVLVLLTGTMIEAANTIGGLNLPVMVAVPVVPVVITDKGLGVLSLGLGDFFFAGLLAIQSFKKYGGRFSLISVGVMTASFFIFEILLLNYLQRAFPGTLMIICGWLLLVALKMARPEGCKIISS